MVWLRREARDVRVGGETIDSVCRLTVRQATRFFEALELALEITRWAMERIKPDLDRHPDYQERHRDKLLADGRTIVCSICEPIFIDPKGERLNA